MNILLSHQELVEITDLAQPRAQIRWLDAHDWRYTLGASGRPKVAREQFLARLAPESVRPVQAAEAAVTYTVNVAALPRGKTKK